MTTKPDLTTNYMGLLLPHPFIAGASPLGARLDALKELEEGGAAAVVLHSLFEEQITEAATGRIHGVDRFDSAAVRDRVAAFPPLDSYPLSPAAYVDHLRAAKRTLSIPVFASLNGTAAGVWLEQAGLLEEAGADGIEVNFYNVNADPRLSSESVERGIVRAVETLKRSVRIPVAVKLTPFFTTFAHLATRLSAAGADALVIFNRFYQPDIDLNSMSIVPQVRLSNTDELPLRLRWLSILDPHVKCSLALSGGVTTWRDGAKAILAGAHAVQSTSAVLRDGPLVLGRLADGLSEWMTRHNFTSISQCRGRLNLAGEPHNVPSERAGYIQTLHGLPS